jgi:1-acyl-sn-glycerol-3-phosphate acyltransferase
LKGASDRLVAVRGLLQACVSRFSPVFVRAPLMLYTGVRHFDVPSIRAVEGGLVLASNHQSFLDPVLVGMALNEPICYLARSDLFAVPGLGLLLPMLRVHPVARGRADSTALRTVLRLLRAGQKVLLFPEGTRSRDGSLGAFKRGAAALAIRAGVPVMPVCVEGSFVCWPRTQTLPRPGRVAVAYGDVLRPQGADADELTRRVRCDVAGMQAALREYLGYEQ